MRFYSAWVAALLAALTVLCAATGHAQSTRSEAIEDAKSAYAEARAALETGNIVDPAAMERRLRDLRDESRRRLASVDREVEGVRGQIEPLGPAPGENDPVESEELAAERTALNQELVRLNSQRTRINANIIEANDLLARISASQIQSLYAQLIVRGASPLMPPVWLGAVDSAADVSGRISKYFSDWAANKDESREYASSIGVIIGALVISLLLFGPVNRWVTATFSHAIERRRPTPTRRVVVAGLKMIARGIPGLIGGVIILETLRAQGVIVEKGAAAAQALWFGLIAYLLVSGFMSGLFAARNPDWRLGGVELKSGRHISALIITIIIVYGLKTLLDAILVATGGSGNLVRLIEAASAIIVAINLFLLCRTKLWSFGALEENQPSSSDIPSRKKPSGVRLLSWRLFRRIGRAVAIVTGVAALLGYVAFAEFAASRIYFLTIFFVLAWFVRATLKESAFWFRRRIKDGADTTDADNDEDEQRAANFQFWSSLLINTGLFVALLPALLVLFGVPASNVRDLAGQALFGFNLGGVRIPSIANFVVAIVIFVAVMALTRVAQRGFQKGPFAHSHIDSGVQNSLITLIGYAGLVVAFFASVSTIGLDLSNLALIAGALSVGIGFGLQSIVNNFVSGLILLFERPIKVGDWIVTASGEGTVKRISVRSTEIETFDRASIIVPNSELISSTVTNWTHKNRIGRIIVRIGVSYNADPELVRDILLKCANDHPLVVRYPEAFVVWQDFGASSLDFELRAYLSDISNGLKTRSDLRYAMFTALAEAGVEIPFPQQDVHVKSLPDGLVAQGPNSASA